MSENRSRVRLVQPSSTRGESTAPPASTRSIPTLKSAARHGLLRHRHVEEQLRDKDGEVFLPQSIYQKIMEHLSSDTSRELGGLLVGTELEGDDGRPTILIQDALPARHTRSHQTRLNFSEETWADFNRELDALEAQGVKLQRVGWYHSHPQMGIFLSPWDLDVCREFRRPTQVALVIDPCEPKGGFFVQGPKGFRDHAPQGFWEMKDLTPDSVVRWTGLTQGPELPSSFLLDWLTPGAAVRPDSQPRTTVIASTQLAPISSPNNRYKPPTPPQANPRPSQWITAAAMLLASLAMAAVLWIHIDRKSDKELLAKQEKELKWKTNEVDSLKATIQEMAGREEPAPAPVKPAPAPVKPAPAPVTPAPAPVKPAPAPVKPAPAPVKPAPAPVKPVTAPVKPVTAPDKPVAAPDKPVTAPDKPAIAPDKPAIAPDKPATAPDNPATAPDKPATAPDKPATAPDKPVTAPEKPATPPEKPATAPEKSAQTWKEKWAERREENEKEAAARAEKKRAEKELKEKEKAERRAKEKAEKEKEKPPKGSSGDGPKEEA